MAEFWTLVWALILTVLTIYHFVCRRLNYFVDKGVPFVAGIPVFGNMWELVFRVKTLADTVSPVYYKDPDAKYIGFFDFHNPVIIVRDPELIKSITIKNFEHFPDHKMMAEEIPDALFKNNLFGLQGQRWKDTRSILSPSFTSSKMKTLFKLVEECANNIVEHIKHQVSNESNIFDMKDVLTKYSNDVIVTSAYGISINSLKEPKNDFLRMGKLATNFAGSRSLRLFFVRSFPKISRLLDVKLFSKSISDFFENVVKTTIDYRRSKGIARPDMLQLMMQARDKSGSVGLSDDYMTANAFIFYFGGFDTTALLMCFAIHLIAVNSNVQNKLRSEVMKVLKECDGKVSYEALHAMRYLDAVINETLRLHTPAVVVDRLCRRDFELPPAKPGLKPFVVQQGSSVWFPISAIHRDEKYFKNANQFRPERFIEDEIDPMTFIPFGSGPRICIGNRFGTMVAKLIIFELVANFDLTTCSKTVDPLKISIDSFIPAIDGSVWLRLEPREASF